MFFLDYRFRQCLVIVYSIFYPLFLVSSNFEVFKPIKNNLGFEGLHNHGGDEDTHDGHDHEAHGDEAHDDEHGEYLVIVGKMGVLVAAIYFFWIFESLMAIVGRGHSHGHYKFKSQLFEYQKLYFST